MELGCCSFLKRSVLELLAQYDAAVLNPCGQDIIRLDAGRGEKLAGKPDSLAVSPGLKLNLHFIPSSLLDVYTWYKRERSGCQWKSMLKQAKLLMPAYRSCCSYLLCCAFLTALCCLIFLKNSSIILVGA